MPKVLLICLIAFLFLGISSLSIYSWYHPRLLSPGFQRDLRQRNLTKFQFNELSGRQFQGSPINLEKVLQDAPDYTSFLFSFKNDDGNRITGQFNAPKNPLSQKPLVLLVRGYVDKEIYTTGTGTKNAAAFFAQKGYYTISPDFLGFGGSDPDTDDILTNRFEKPATILSLLSSLKYPIGDLTLKDSPIGIWAHSNGGQITLSVLEITQKSIPATLWAPVSIGFPDSVTHFLSDYGSQAKYIEDDLSEFENRYVPDDYSIAAYFDRIHAPIQLHQGGRDDAVPQKWSDSLAQTLLNLGLDLDYYVYPRSDHNMRPDWNTAIARDLVFFAKHLNRPLSSTE